MLGHQSNLDVDGDSQPAERCDDATAAAQKAMSKGISNLIEHR
jgi:hypothetical protein